MSLVEKFAFLGAVTLASVLIAHELDQTVATLDAPSEVAGLAGSVSPAPSQLAPEAEAPAPEAPPTLLSLATGPAGFLDTLTACKGMAPSYGANVDSNLIVTDYKRFVLAE